MFLKLQNSKYCTTNLLTHWWCAVSADYSQLEPIFDLSPKRSEATKSLGRLTDGPELASSIRRSFSFSSVTGSITCSSPDRKEEEFGSFRMDDEDNVGQPETPGSVPARTRRKKAPSWNGLVSIFRPAKRDPTTLTDEVKNRNIDVFRPYCTFLQAPYDEAAYRALMKPPLGGLATIISRDLKRWSVFGLDPCKVADPFIRSWICLEL